MSHNSRTSFPQGNFDYNIMPGPVKGEVIWNNRYQGIASDGSVNNQLPMELGTSFVTAEGKCYRFVMNDTATAFVAGNILSSTNILAVSGAPVVTAGSLDQITGCTGLKVGEYRGGYAYMSAATGTGADGQIARVVWNTATTIYLDRNMVAATSVTLKLWHPWKMKVTAAGSAAANQGINARVAGVSVGAVPAATGSGMFVAGGVSYFGWMQTKGLCDRVLVTAAAIAAGQLSGGLTGSATVAGQADPIGSATTPDDVRIFGYAIPEFAFDVAVPAELFCE